jgi:hypothetical protein
MVLRHLAWLLLRDLAHLEKQEWQILLLIRRQKTIGLAYGGYVARMKVR